jgi:maleate isomerase
VRFTEKDEVNKIGASLSLIEPAETEFGLPVLSASTATAFTLLRRLGLPTVLPGAGRLLQKDR